MKNKRWLKVTVIVVLLVGWLILAWPAGAAAPAAAHHQGGIVHVVRAGETLSEIAKRYGVSLSALAQANGIGNVNRIYAGQRLVIPGSSSRGAVGSGGGAVRATTVHFVRSGETLGTIAARYGTTVSALAQANRIHNPNQIYVGQRLIIVPARRSSSRPVRGAVGGGTVPAPPPSGGRRWIEIDLSAQTLTAYEGNRPVFQRLVSTGLPRTPTPIGTFRILWKLPSQRMTGPGYDLPNVPWVMYFTNRGHAIHGAYWHNNFGHPMSHGCVNMRPGDAHWLYNFAPVGTTVVVRQ